MRISIESLIIKNFKGIKDFNLTLNSESIKVFGANATGKSTIGDALNWLLFGKNSMDQAKFEMQPLDENNEIIHHLDTSVEGLFKIDGKQVSLKRVLSEKWVKRQGVADRVFEGTVTNYFVNDVPSKKKEYECYIYNIVDSEIFKLLTNTNYFCALDWKKQREILMSIAENVSDAAVINNNKELEFLSKLLENDDIDNIRKRIKFQVKKHKEERQDIPGKIEELNLQLGGSQPIEALNFRKNNLEKGIADKEKELVDASPELYKKTLENELKEKEIAYENKVSDAKKKINEPREELGVEYRKLNSDLMKVEYDIKGLERLINGNTVEVARIEKSIELCNEKREYLVSRFNEVKEKEFSINEHDLNCPMCGQALPGESQVEKVANLEKTYNENKQKELEDIRQLGQSNNATKEGLEATLKEVKATITDCKAKVSNAIAEKDKLSGRYEEVKTALNLFDSKTVEITYPGMNDDIAAIKELKEKIENVSYAKADGIREEIKALNENLKIVNEDIAKLNAMEGIRTRIVELEAQELELSQKIAELERQDFKCEEFVRAKIDLLENEINSHFGLVKFKLFNQLVKGTIEETCQPMINGVPYSSLNTASKINCGLDIIKTLSNVYGVNAPIFIDNRESVSRIINMDSQLIHLIVSENDERLRVENV